MGVGALDELAVVVEFGLLVRAGEVGVEGF